MAKKMRKSSVFFTTVTFKDGVEDPIVLQRLRDEFSRNRYKRVFMVRETGAYGKNNHFHAFLETATATRTDHITAKIKTFYRDPNVVNRYTVKTVKENDPIYRVGRYMVKETDYYVLMEEGMDHRTYVSMYEKRQGLCDKLFRQKNFRRCKVDEIPSVYMAYCDKGALDRNNIVPNLALMIRDGLLQASQVKALKACIVVISCMIDPKLGETVLENYLM